MVLFARNSELEKRVKYIQNNKDISIAFASQENNKTYLDFNHTNGTIFQFIFDFQAKKLACSFYDGSAWDEKDLLNWS